MDFFKKSIRISRLILKAPLSLFLLVGVSCHPLDALYKEISHYGYIPFPSPLEFAGPGTMVGGSPKRLSLVASPETCFPDVINGVPTDIRRVDNTSLPKRSYRFSFGGSAKLKLIDFLQMGNPVLSAGAQFSKVKTIEMKMEGASIQYLNAIKLTELYPQISNICKDYLEHVGFIIQALKVEKLSFSFKNSSNGLIKLDLNNLDQIVDIGANVNYSINNEVTLEITTPKYIGYQLGRLLAKDNGLTLYRASKVFMGKFRFVSIDIFKDHVPQVASANNSANKDNSGEKIKENLEEVLELNEIEKGDLELIKDELQTIPENHLKPLDKGDFIAPFSEMP